MKVLIREGSAAKNFEALIGLLPTYWENLMFCSDDKHPDSLLEGHINLLVQRAIAKGMDLFKVLQVACINPVKHYGLDVGLLQVGEPADFIVVDNLEDFKVLQAYIDGELISENGVSKIPYISSPIINHFQATPKSPEDFAILSNDKRAVRVIEALDGQLITNALEASLTPVDGRLMSDTSQDVLKITVVNRYHEAKPAVAFIKNFGLKKGALASSVGHDSHNIIAVGVDDHSICEAVNLLIEHKGGVSAVNGDEKQVLPLPVGGIMTNVDGYEVAQSYIALDRMAKSMGSLLASPYMTLSFMALLVIPSLKLSDKGLFDGQYFKFVALLDDNN